MEKELVKSKATKIAMVYESDVIKSIIETENVGTWQINLPFDSDLFNDNIENLKAEFKEYLPDFLEWMQREYGDRFTGIYTFSEHIKPEELRDKDELIECFQLEDERLNHSMFMFPGNEAFPVSFGGKSLWSDIKEPKVIKIDKIEVYNNTHEPEMRVYFDKDSWNTKNDGLIYTDKQFESDINYILFSNHRHNKFNHIEAVYTEQGMQSDYYVSMSIQKKDLKEALKRIHRFREEWVGNMEKHKVLNKKVNPTSSLDYVDIVVKNENCIPYKKHKSDAGFDLKADIEENIVLKPGERKLISAGIKIGLPDGYETQIRPRSGLAYKNGISVVNAPGTIDSSYRDWVRVLLINLGQEDFTVEPGMRIAQMVIKQVELPELTIVESLDDTERGTGGFGSTGVK